MKDSIHITGGNCTRRDSYTAILRGFWTDITLAWIQYSADKGRSRKDDNGKRKSHVGDKWVGL